MLVVPKKNKRLNFVHGQKIDTNGSRNSAARLRMLAKDPDFDRRSWLKRKYGLTLEEYKQMIEDQSNLCWLCKKPETAVRLGKPLPLAIDHNHKTGKVRKLLCQKCNRGIGIFQDDPDLLESASNYLREYSTIDGLTHD